MKISRTEYDAIKEKANAFDNFVYYLEYIADKTEYASVSVDADIIQVLFGVNKKAEKKPTVLPDDKGLSKDNHLNDTTEPNADQEKE